MDEIINKLRETHCATNFIVDFYEDGSSVEQKYSYSICCECRHEWPCFTIGLIDGTADYELDESEVEND